MLRRSTLEPNRNTTSLSETTYGQRLVEVGLATSTGGIMP